MDWLFISQTIILVTVYLLSDYFYKNQWSFTRNSVEIENKHFPRIGNFLEKDFNNKGIFYYFLFGTLCIVIISAFFGGMVFIFIVIRGIFNEFEKVMAVRSWWEQVAICISLILFYFAIKIKLDVSYKK